MAVFVQQPNALALLTQLEGDRWLQQQHRFPYSETGFFVWLAAFNWRFSKEGAEELGRNGIEAIDLPLAEIIDGGFILVDSATGSLGIYGAGGFHRYSVLSDGEIVFLASYARTQAYLAAASVLGFSVR